MTRRINPLAAGVLVLCLAAPLTARAQSLTDALIDAYKNSFQLKAQRAALQATDEGVAQAVAAQRPALNASASVGATRLLNFNSTTRTASLALSLKLTLWDGGAGQLGQEVAHQNVLVNRRNLTDTEQSVLLAAVTAYMDMRRDAKNLKLAESNRTVLARQVRATRERFDVGEVRRTDVSQVEASLALAQSNVALRQGQLEISREAYHVATGKYPGVLRTPPPLPALPATLAAAKSIALRTHPSIARARILSRIADLNVARAEAAMKPKFSLGGAVGINANSSSGDTVNLSITGAVPLYQGGALSAAYRRAQELRDKSRADVERAAQLVVQQLNRVWAQLKIAKATIVARQKEVRASRVALQGIREEADLGARTTLDVLNAESALLKAQTNLSVARHDEYVSTYGVLAAMGLLTVRHLRLGVKPYDPGVHYKKVAGAPRLSARAKLLKRIFKRAGKK